MYVVSSVVRTGQQNIIVFYQMVWDIRTLNYKYVFVRGPLIKSDNSTTIVPLYCFWIWFIDDLKLNVSFNIYNMNGNVHTRNRCGISG